MKKSNSMQKAQSAFWNLGAVALITATIFFVACKQTGGGGSGTGTGGGGTPTPKPKHAIAFSVDGANGTLKVEGDGITQPATSPINVEEGKTVTFTATANDGYRVKGWTLDGSPITEAGTKTEYKLTVTKAVTLKVSFEKIPPIKHAVSFTVVDGKGGTLKAKAEGIYETEESPITVEEGKSVTFTATPDEGYRVKSWTLDGSPITEVGTGTEYSHKVKGPCMVIVSFELGKAILTIEGMKSTIKVTAKTQDGSAIEVEGCDKRSLESGVQTRLRPTETTVTLKGYITELDCSGDNTGWIDKLTTLDVHGLTALHKLVCGNNKLPELNVQGLTKLQILWCSINQLTELDVHGLTALQQLSCEANQLTELNVQGCTSLKELRCSNNKLTELNVQGLTSLQDISCGSNKLTALNVQGLTALQVLWCSNNQLTDLDVSGLTALKEFNCHRNKLNAKTMTKLLEALPARVAGDGAEARLYTEDTVEGNCKDFTKPQSLKIALKAAKGRNWKLKKYSIHKKKWIDI